MCTRHCNLALESHVQCWLTDSYSFTKATACIPRQGPSFEEPRANVMGTRSRSSTRFRLILHASRGCICHHLLSTTFFSSSLLSFRSFLPSSSVFSTTTCWLSYLFHAHFSNRSGISVSCPLVFSSPSCTVCPLLLESINQQYRLYIQLHVNLHDLRNQRQS